MQKANGSVNAGFLVTGETFLHNVLNLCDELRIRLQPLFNLAAVEVLCRKVQIVGHAGGKLRGGIGPKVLGGIVIDAQVFVYKVFLNLYRLSLHRLFNLVKVPAFFGVSDKEAAADAGKRVRDIGRYGNAAFNLIKGHFMLFGHEGAFSHPKGEDGHAKGIEIGLMG